MAAQSFHETKNISCGEGGALIINDDRYARRAEIVREKGTNRASFFRGEVDKYSWVDKGSSYVMSDILAAFLLAQIKEADKIQQKRARIWQRYQRGLEGWAHSNDIGLPVVPVHCEQAYHMFYLLMPSRQARTQLISRLRASGIHAVFHYVPLHDSKMGAQCGRAPGGCPVSSEASDRLVRLPFFNDLEGIEQEAVIEEIVSSL
jgi:dTDP-4-amino-4,6-dideoxygalactose transaminase